MNKVSIIVPVYKTEEYLDQCVSSILSSTYVDLEVLLIDDGSPDNCPIMCNNWGKKDKRVRTIHKKNGGLSDARNVGLDYATGDYIGFVDSDDIISSFMIEDMIKLMTENDADIGCFEFARFSDNSTPNYSRFSKYHVVNSQDALAYLLDEKISNHACNKLFKKNIFDNMKFLIGKKYEDIGIMYKLILNSRSILLCNGFYYGYFYRDESITNTVKQESINDMVELINDRFNFLKNDSFLHEKLIVSRLKSIYLYHLKSVSNSSVFFSSTLDMEYDFFKKHINVKRILLFMSKNKITDIINKLIFIMSKKLFYKFKMRGRHND